MKWINRKHYRKIKAQERERRKHHWHKWYAWLPVPIEETRHDGIVVPAHYVWLEYVERRRYDKWKYRTPKTEEELPPGVQIVPMEDPTITLPADLRVGDMVTVVAMGDGTYQILGGGGGRMAI